MKVHEQYYLGAVFGDHEHAEAAVGELRSSGISEKHLGIIVRDPEERDRLGAEIDVETGHAVKKGMAMGVPAGMLAGIAISAIAVPGGVLGMGGILASAAAGATTGAALGGYFGLYADRALDEVAAWEDIQLGPREVLVAVHPAADRERVRHILSRHGGRQLGAGSTGLTAALPEQNRASSRPPTVPDRWSES